MTGILKGIGNFAYALVQLLLNLINGIIHMLTMIPSALTMLMNSIGYMPVVLVSFAIGLVTVSVVFLVIGR